MEINSSSLLISSCYSTSCREASNCPCPRKASHPLYAELCGPPPSPLRTSPASGTPRTRGAPEEMPCWPSAMRDRNHGLLRALRPHYAGPYVSHNIYFRPPQAPCIRDACRESCYQSKLITPPRDDTGRSVRCLPCRAEPVSKSVFSYSLLNQALPSQKILCLRTIFTGVPFVMRRFTNLDKLQEMLSGAYRPIHFQGHSFAAGQHLTILEPFRNP